MNLSDFISIFWSTSTAVDMTTDEAESHQKKPRQQEEAGQGARPPTPEDDQLRPQNHNPAGRGLTRLFSSLLKRRSQFESEGGEKEDKEEEAKAPIADPEPELKTEGEVALDQHSVSSAEAQVSLCWWLCYRLRSYLWYVRKCVMDRVAKYFL